MYRSVKLVYLYLFNKCCHYCLYVKYYIQMITMQIFVIMKNNWYIALYRFSTNETALTTYTRPLETFSFEMAEQAFPNMIS